MNVFSTYIFPNTNQNEILIYTEYVVVSTDTSSTLFYRAQLEYKSGSWNDWVYTLRGNNHLVPAKILLFFEIKQWSANLPVGNNHDITCPGKYAFCNLINDYCICTDINNTNPNF